MRRGTVTGRRRVPVMCIELRELRPRHLHNMFRPVPGLGQVARIIIFPLAVDVVHARPEPRCDLTNGREDVDLWELLS